MNLNAKLSKREYEIAELIAWGASKKEVPDFLAINSDKKRISIRTVENILCRVYRKIGIQKPTELSVWWFTKHFHISMDFSPFKRTMFSILFLMMLLPQIVGLNCSEYRKPSRKSNQIQIVQIRNRNRRSDLDIMYLFNNTLKITA